MNISPFSSFPESYCKVTLVVDSVCHQILDLLSRQFYFDSSISSSSGHWVPSMHVGVEELYTRWDLEMFSGSDIRMIARLHVSSLHFTRIEWLTWLYVVSNHIFLSLSSSRASFVPPGSNCSIARFSSEWYSAFNFHTVSLCCCIVLSLPPGSYCKITHSFNGSLGEASASPNHQFVLLTP